jgi:ABC-2 type transport system permease protein
MISESLAIGGRAITKWLRNPFAVIAALVQATFWLLLFGNSFNPANAFSSSSLGAGALGVFQEVFGGAANYITFLTPGVIGIVSLTAMSFMGVDTVLDRMSGYLDMLSTYPIPRTSIYFGAMIQNIAKAIATAVATFLLAFFVPNGLRLVQGFSVVDLAGVLLVFALLSLVFSALFSGIAISVKSTDSFFAFVNFLTFPIMFTSTALFPLAFFPSWLKPVAEANPVSLSSEATRLLIVNGSLTGAQLSTLAGDIAGLLVYGVVFGTLGIMMARNALKPR